MSLHTEKYCEIEIIIKSIEQLPKYARKRGGRQPGDRAPRAVHLELGRSRFFAKSRYNRMFEMRERPFAIGRLVLQGYKDE